MRLYKDERKALDNILADINDEVYLFGSRVDDNKKGGDIDILIFSIENPYKLSQKINTAFQMQCDEKIDVIVFNKDNLTKEQQAFLNTIDNKIRLK